MPAERRVTDDTARLRWQCRRGMRELDTLLTRYLSKAYALADEDERAAFRDLLTLSDPELASYFLGRAVPDDKNIARAVERILSQP